MIPTARLSRLGQALPFWLSLGTLPLALAALAWGGVWVFLMPFYTWALYGLLDLWQGESLESADPEAPEAALFWYRLITWVWVPLQGAALVAVLVILPEAPLALWEKIMIAVGQGILSGTVGIVYAHELLHQRNRFERGLGDLLLAMVLYSHFRSEHLRVHHPFVGTPRDPVTARYGEGFHAFFWRVIRACPASAWAAEREFLARAGKSVWARENPFWRYGALQGTMLALAFALGGWVGLGLFLLQALVAVWQLELTNYIEHYGLLRRETAPGRYEPVRPHHSWNANHRASNWLLINLQRHSDHHARPDRRFPLLQAHAAGSAPQLPYGYPVMGVLALFPRKWRAMMNPRVRAWRKQFYPEVTDWS